MNINYKHITIVAIGLGGLLAVTEASASDLTALETEITRVKTFFTGSFFKTGMATGTVVGIIRAIHQGNIGLGMVTAGIGVGGFSLLSWITH